MSLSCITSELYKKYNATKKTTQKDMLTECAQAPHNDQPQSAVAEAHRDNSRARNITVTSTSMTVWGPELNKQTIQKKSSLPHGEKGNRKTAGGSSVLDKVGEKLFLKFSSAPSTPFKTKQIMHRSQTCEAPNEIVSPELALEENITSSYADCETFCPPKVMTIEALSLENTSTFTETEHVKGAFCGKTFRLLSGKKSTSLSIEETDIPKKFLKPKLKRKIHSVTDADNIDSSFEQEFELKDKSENKLCIHELSSPAGNDVHNNTSVHELSPKELKSPGKTDGNTKGCSFSLLDSLPKKKTEMDKMFNNSDSRLLKPYEFHATVPEDTRNIGYSRKQKGLKKNVHQSHKSISPNFTFDDYIDGSAYESLSLDVSDTVKQSNTDETNNGSKKNPGEKKGNCSRKMSSAAGKATQKRKTPEDTSFEERTDSVRDCSSNVTLQKTAKRVRQSRKKSETSSASLSENFVRLNMKAKKFVRKSSRLTGAQWKRKQWKQRMAARSQSYGDKCFRCGQSGHWANKCPGVEGSESCHPNVTSSPTSVAESDFPSLRQAALMARGIRDDDGMADLERAGGDELLAVEAMAVREKPDLPLIPLSVTPLAQQLSDVEGLIEKGLQKFGFTSFRPGQRETIKRILSGQSTMVIMSTGGGKSLCYQLPACLYREQMKCVTLVVSPLVSLMEDQISGLPLGIKGACLHSNMTPTQRESVLAEVCDGKVDFLLVSPEAVVGGGKAQGSFPSADKMPPIAFACIDEVHCLSEWSHNFRPSYLRLCKVLREKYGVSCFLGLTATARKSTVRDVARHIGISDLETATIRGSPVPPNLCLSVSKDGNRDEALVNLLQGKRFSECDSLIIYCTRREQVERVATLIRTSLQLTGSIRRGKGRKSKTSDLASPSGKWTVETYHAGLTPPQRRRIQKDFMSGSVNVVVATVAFGMGLDKADVRAIVHYNMPKSFENYVQEIGRAGRDGEISHCHLFLDPQGHDLGELRRHTFGNTIDRFAIKKLLQKLFPKCRCDEVHLLRGKKTELSGELGEEARDVARQNVSERVCPGHERALPKAQTIQDLDIREEGIETLLCYLELHAPHILSNLAPVYATCQLQCYGGPQQLQAVAKKCPPVGVAIARQKLRGERFERASSLTFPVVDISDSMGWDAGPVKRELSRLQWTFDTGGARKSGVLVQFSDLAFHMRTCGDLSDDELDGLVDFLHERVMRQERAELAQLALLGDRLGKVAHKNYWMCANEVDLKRSNALKKYLDDYFDEADEEKDGLVNLSVEEPDACSLGQLTSDIRLFIQTYGGEHILSARSIARVFHGIDSPRFPAAVWGRVRRFWRSHLHVHFHVVLREAGTQLLLLREK
ncbi:ATP-dependent DNA helicase Q4-like isoform X3 [Pomacea canaliculata]|uniref:ATP-dependent DNA helicase Q4-like isoform X3 n=1 Tax=Pomacea canaliculata TaxID=400727 RepID=UPI000D73E0D9|nr:ATP-dependent DNA helicase Q4-like isoform X3 [Pomacea canaliculata]